VLSTALSSLPTTSAGSSGSPSATPASSTSLHSAAATAQLALQLPRGQASREGFYAPLRARILYARHKAFMSQQRLPQAIADLTAVCELDARHVLARLQRANLQLMTGRCAEAVADYGAVLALDASKRDAHARMPHAAECKAALERADRARAARQNEALRDALTDAIAEGRATSAPALLMERALVYIQLGGEDNNANALADLARHGLCARAGASDRAPSGR
jgi:tetratricopeptide (TPR) repeat protein